MTRRDFMGLYHPSKVDRLFEGDVCGCPNDYPDLCMADPTAQRAGDVMGCKIPGGSVCDDPCTKCWDTEIPETAAEAIEDARIKRVRAQILNEARAKTAAKTVEGAAIERIRAQILNEARDIICSDRNKQYGEPEDNFAVIGELWSQYLRRAKDVAIDLNGYDVGMLMALFKIGRLETGTPKRDNFVDLAGYVACAAERALREEQK